MKNLVKKNCKICGIEFLGGTRTLTCSKECARKLNNKQTFERKFNENNLKFENADPNSYVTCSICGFKSGDISIHVKSHNISNNDYKKQYGNTKSQNALDKMIGSNNPGYNHGGKLSSFSKKFVKYETLSEEEKSNAIAVKYAEVSKIKEENPQNNPTRIEYYLAKGMSEKEAQVALSNRQTTFSLKICIEKYGEVVGKQIWQERQDKWMNSLDNKTDEEKEEIRRKKGTNFSYKDIVQNNVEIPGTLYLIKISEHQYKIGITTKTLSQRYSSDIYKDYDIIYLNNLENITHIFKVEQIIKHNYREYVKYRDYGQFGWTEVFNEVDGNKLYEDINYYMSDKETTNNIYSNIYE